MLAVSLALFVVGCGRSDLSPDAATQRALNKAKAAKADKDEQRPPPTTEGAVVEAVARAIEARDINKLRELTVPEFNADLGRLHQTDPIKFWARAGQWVANVGSGFTITYRQDPETHEVWKVLIEFGNGKQERVMFTRDAGRLVLYEM